MTDIERILQVFKQSSSAKSLGFKIDPKSLGAGGQGTVFLATNRIGKHYAIKFTKPDSAQPERMAERVGKFFNELKILTAFANKNIIRVHTGGYCDMRVADNELTLVETVTRPTDSEDRFVYFSVMDYVPKSLADLFPVSSINYQEPTPPIALNTHERQVTYFEKLVHHIAKAIDYCHARTLYHNDIKSENILFSEDDETFLLADFGHAQRNPDSKEQDFIRRWPINHPHYKFDKKPKDNDLYAFSLVLFAILESLENCYDPHRYGALHEILTRATDKRIESFPFPNATALHDALARYFLRTTWSLKLHVGEYLVPSSGNRFLIDSKIRLPVSGSVYTTPEVRRIIDTPEFQRLRGVKQLGPTEFVFPGATHTRFEHSLGTYHLSLRYLETLTRIPEFNECCSPLIEIVQFTTLACLLHDIGHYPFSHWIEEIEEWPNGLTFPGHERRAEDIIENGAIGELIKKDWGIDSKSLFAIIGSGRLPKSLMIVKTIIDSVLDVDKLDYLNRDSTHCGVDYGSSLDIPRLLEALHVDKDNSKICVTHKAKTYLMSLLACRNMMYTDVYWHKTVRALTGMFKYFMYRATERGVLTKEFLEGVFLQTDAVFVENVIRRVVEQNANSLLPLIMPFAYKGRSIYRPAFTFSESHLDERPSVVTFFQPLLNANYPILVSRADRLTKELHAKHGPVAEHDVIIEKTPAKEGKERYDIGKLRIWNTRRKEFEHKPRKVSELNEFLSANQQAFVLCSPRVYPRLRTLTLDQWDAVFEAANTVK